MSERSSSKPSSGHGAAVVALLCGVLLLPGCALQRYEPRALDPGALPATIAVARLDDAAHEALLRRYGHAGAWPPASWTPAALGLLAASRSTALRSAQAAVLTRRAERDVAGQPSRPAVSLAVERNSDRDPGDDSKWGVGPGFSFFFSPMGKRELRAAMAGADIMRAEAVVLTAAWAARHDAVVAALDLRARRRAHALLDAQAARTREATEAAGAAAAAGLSDGFEWQMLQLEANTVRLDRLDRFTGIASAGAALAGALELPLGALDGLEIDAAGATDAAALPDHDTVQRRALSSHPAVFAALADYDRAERELELAIAEQYPDVELSPGYFFDQGDNVWSLAGSIVVPLFANHDAAIERARLARDEARAGFESLQARIITSVQLAHARARAGADAVLAARTVAADVGRRRAALERQHAEGLVERLTVARTAIRQLIVERRVAALEARAERAARELEYAAGAALFDPAFDRFLRDVHDGGVRLPGVPES